MQKSPFQSSPQIIRSAFKLLDDLSYKELENGWDDRFILGKLCDNSFTRKPLQSENVSKYCSNDLIIKVKQSTNNTHSVENSVDYQDTAQRKSLAKQAVQQREQILTQLKLVVNNWPDKSKKSNAVNNQKQKEKSSTLLQKYFKRLKQLAKDLQYAGLKCIESIVSWLMNFDDPKKAYLYNGQNYLFKMHSSLDFVYETLGEDAEKLGFHISNPLLIGCNYLTCEERNRLAIAQMVINDALAGKKESTKRRKFKAGNDNERIVKNSLSKEVNRNIRNKKKGRTKQQQLQENTCSLPKIGNSTYLENSADPLHKSTYFEKHGEKNRCKQSSSQHKKASCYLPKIQTPVHDNNSIDQTNQSLDYEDCSDFSLDHHSSQKVITNLTSIEKEYIMDKENNDNYRNDDTKSSSDFSEDSFDSETYSYSSTESTKQNQPKASFSNIDKSIDENYSIICILGEGAFGEVYRVRNRINQQDFAMKRFKKISNTEEDDASEEFYQEREIEICKKLNQHKNIISLIEVTKFEGEICIVFELMSMNCLTLINDNPKGLDKSIVLSLSKQLLISVEYCHENKVMHRDIKPENILIEKQKTGSHMDSYLLKLCDFGTSRYYTENKIDHRHSTTTRNPMEQLSSLTHYVGSRWYRAPEQLGNSTSYGFLIDIWAVACIIYELSIGMPLFCGDNENEVIEAIASVIEIPHKSLQALQQRGFLRRKSSIKKTIRHQGEEESEPFQFITSKLGEDGSSLLKGMLQVDSEERFSASKCLSSAFLNEIILPTSDSSISNSTGTVDDDYESNEYEEDSDFDNDYSDDNLSNSSFVD